MRLIDADTLKEELASHFDVELEPLVEKEVLRMIDEQETISDCISRQAAIDALEREKSLVERPITETRWFDFGLGKAQDVLSELPSAQPERKKGKWIRHDEIKNVYGGICIECSECGEKYVVQHILDEKYCRNCGAKMEVGENAD